MRSFFGSDLFIPGFIIALVVLLGVEVLWNLLRGRKHGR
jgi:hypothetical protein